MEKRFQNAVPACILLRKTFWNSVLARSVTKIPLVVTYFKVLSHHLPGGIEENYENVIRIAHLWV
jgi:hypothetical protein